MSLARAIAVINNRCPDKEEKKLKKAIKEALKKFKEEK